MVREPTFSSLYEQPILITFPGVPNIVVSGGEPFTPPTSTQDIASPFTGYLDTPHGRISLSSPSPEMTFALETPSKSPLQRSKRMSDASMLSVQESSNRTS